MDIVFQNCSIKIKRCQESVRHVALTLSVNFILLLKVTIRRRKLLLPSNIFQRAKKGNSIIVSLFFDFVKVTFKNIF